MDMRIEPGKLSGEIDVPPSKSMAHRLTLCAALADGESEIQGAAFSDDIAATVGAVTALGARVADSGGVLSVRGPLRRGGEAAVDCNESGSTLRFLVPVAAALGVAASYSGRGRLPQRPIGPLAEVMERRGARFSRLGGMPFTVSGQLTPGRYVLPGNVSSQYITGLMYALPLLDAPSEIELSTPLESAGYVCMTLRALARSGVAVEETARGWRVPAPQEYRPIRARVEGDWSNAAFWLCLNALGSDVRCVGLDEDSAQGDRAAVRILSEMRSGAAEAHIDVSGVPDLVPALCAAAAGLEGVVTVFENAARLRMKECDRLHAMAEVLAGLGGRARELPDAIEVAGIGRLRGGAVDGYGDHRIVMAAAVAASICEGPVVIRGAQAVRKSYPDFFTHYQALGGVCHVVGMGE